jgi:hypothetical protein
MYPRGTWGTPKVLSGYSTGYVRRARLRITRSSVLKRQLRGTHRVLGRARARYSARYRRGADAVPTRYGQSSDGISEVGLGPLCVCVCVRARGLACACNGRVRVHGFVCVRVGVCSEFARFRARSCLSTCAVCERACVCVRAFPSDCIFARACVRRVCVCVCVW